MTLKTLRDEIKAMLQSQGFNYEHFSLKNECWDDDEPRYRLAIHLKGRLDAEYTVEKTEALELLRSLGAWLTNRAEVESFAQSAEQGLDLSVTSEGVFITDFDDSDGDVHRTSLLSKF